MIAFSVVQKVLLALALGSFQGASSNSDEALLTAAQRNDTVGVMRALDQGANINTESQGHVTAVMFAARNDNFEMVKLLVERRADLSVQDAFFIKTATEEAIALGNLEIVRYLNSKGAPSAEYILAFAVEKKDLTLLAAAGRRPDIPDVVIAATHAVALRNGETEIAAVLADAKEARRDASDSLLSIPRTVLERFVGTYRDDRTAQSIVVVLQQDQLVAILGPRSLMLFPFYESDFRAPEMPNTVFRFSPQGGQATRLRVDSRGLNLDLRRQSN